MKPIITESANQVYFASRTVSIKISTSDSVDGVVYKLWNYGDISYIQLSNFIGGVATTIGIDNPYDGQSASWNCDLQYYITPILEEGIYLRLRHDKSRNMMVKVYVFVQFNM